MKRQVTFTITVDDLRGFFECSKAQANEIWDELNTKHNFQETLKEDMMEQFVGMMWDHEANTLA